ncbi:response regulator [Paraburkholderia strydomiana]|jgi:FixJ family two-component response regulator|uniref:response regulator transcription factor n=1 Tax=Paraburkholderia strydomiana TaxID=1245417 RepID=UPI0038BC660E
MVTVTQIVAVVDDDESVRRALKRLLHSAGVNADTFASGEAFLDSLSSATSSVPVCVITDFELPGIDGLELQRRMIPTGVPIILISGKDDPAVRGKALAQGAAGCLSKPFNGDELIWAVQMIIGLPQKAINP